MGKKTSKIDSNNTDLYFDKKNNFSNKVTCVFQSKT